MYVKRYGNLFYYNAIDTEEGQSGSAIFLRLKDGYVIVGIHTGGDKTDGENWGVALTANTIDAFLRGRGVIDSY